MEFTSVRLVEKTIFNLDELRVGKKIRVKFYHNKDRKYYWVTTATISNIQEEYMDIYTIDPSSGAIEEHGIRIEALGNKFDILEIED